MGFTADIIVWDLATQQMHKKLCLHKVMIQSLAFSHDETKLASLGGPDDGSLVLWDVASGEAICGSPADNKFVECVKFLNNDSNRLMTAGQGTQHGFVMKERDALLSQSKLMVDAGNIHVWEYLASINKLKSAAMELGKVVRWFSCVAISQDDSCIFAGSKSGDLLQINLKRNVLRRTGPKKQLSGGITAVANTSDPHSILIGTGDGLLALMRVSEEVSTCSAC